MQSSQVRTLARGEKNNDIKLEIEFKEKKATIPLFKKAEEITSHIENIYQTFITKIQEIARNSTFYSVESLSRRVYEELPSELMEDIIDDAQTLSSLQHTLQQEAKILIQDINAATCNLSAHLIKKIELKREQQQALAQAEKLRVDKELYQKDQIVKSLQTAARRYKDYLVSSKMWEKNGIERVLRKFNSIITKKEGDKIELDVNYGSGAGLPFDLIDKDEFVKKDFFSIATLIHTNSVEAFVQLVNNILKDCLAEASRIFGSYAVTYLREERDKLSIQFRDLVIEEDRLVLKKPPIDIAADIMTVHHEDEAKILQGEETKLNNIEDKLKVYQKKVADLTSLIEMTAKQFGSESHNEYRKNLGDQSLAAINLSKALDSFKKAFNHFEKVEEAYVEAIEKLKSADLHEQTDWEAKTLIAYKEAEIHYKDFKKVIEATLDDKYFDEIDEKASWLNKRYDVLARHQFSKKTDLLKLKYTKIKGKLGDIDSIHRGCHMLPEIIKSFYSILHAHATAKNQKQIFLHRAAQLAAEDASIENIFNNFGKYENTEIENAHYAEVAKSLEHVRKVKDLYHAITKWVGELRIAEEENRKRLEFFKENIHDAAYLADFSAFYQHLVETLTSAQEMQLKIKGDYNLLKDRQKKLEHYKPIVIEREHARANLQGANKTCTILEALYDEVQDHIKKMRVHAALGEVEEIDESSEYIKQKNLHLVESLYLTDITMREEHAKDALSAVRYSLDQKENVDVGIQENIVKSCEPLHIALNALGVRKGKVETKIHILKKIHLEVQALREDAVETHARKVQAERAVDFIQKFILKNLEKFETMTNYRCIGGGEKLVMGETSYTIPYGLKEMYLWTTKKIDNATILENIRGLAAERLALKKRYRYRIFGLREDPVHTLYHALSAETLEDRISSLQKWDDFSLSKEYAKLTT